ncbi:hypothetical protein BH09GEM1_BH09GEM1_13130 [soil metagenome]
MRVRFRPQARAEIREARRWFEARVTGLGRAFISEVDTTINLLSIYPQMYASVSDDAAVRRAFLHRFPYSLVYEILTEHDIVVLACRHVRQDELEWNVARRGA